MLWWSLAVVYACSVEDVSALLVEFVGGCLCGRKKEQRHVRCHLWRWNETNRDCGAGESFCGERLPHGGCENGRWKP